MATEEERAAAKSRLGALNTKRRELLAVEEEFREAIVEILRSKTLRPSEVVELVDFSAVHVGRIARAGGVPPLREATVVSKKKAEQ